MIRAEPRTKPPQREATSLTALKPAGQTPEWRMYQSLILFFLLGVLVTVGIFLEVRGGDWARRRSAFTSLCENRAKAIQNNADGCMELLNSVGDLYTASEKVERNEFRSFAVRALKRHPETAGLEWLPRVSHLQREVAEKIIGRVIRGFRIMELDFDGKLVLAKARSEYYPAMYVEPFYERRHFLGLDHYATPERKRIMELARDSALPAATTWVILPRHAVDDPDAYVVLIYLPIYTNGQPHDTREQRQRHLQGYLLATAPVVRMVDESWPKNVAEENDIDLYLMEQSSSAEPRPVLHRSRGTWTCATQTLDQVKSARNSKILWEGAVDLAGQPWTLVGFPTAKFIAAERSWSWLVLLVALLFTGFLVNYQRVIIQRAAYVERLVNQRTAELKKEIGERTRVEEELARERDLFHTLLDNLPDRIYFKDYQSKFLRINRALAKLFGLSHPKDALGKSDFDFFTEEHAKPAFADEQDIIKTGQPLIGRVEFETLPDGKTGWAHTTKMPLRDKQGKIVGTFGISRDITTLKQMEDKLAEERNLLANLIEHLPDYIYVTDNHGHYLVVNITFARLVGAAKPEDVLGKTVFDYYPSNVAMARQADDLQVMESSQPVINREEPIPDPASKKRWFLVTKVPLRDARKRVIGLVCVGRDITNRREMEEQLKQANTDLQKSHEELIAAQMQLIQAEKLQSVGRLAAGVAHEVKNPLAILGMGIDYLNSSTEKSDPNVASVIEDMRAAIQRADNIILGLLDFSAPRDLQIEEEDLNQIIEQSLVLTKHEQMGTLVTVQREFGADLPKVKLDANKIMQVFVNLFVNACQAMVNGGVITVRSYQKTLVHGEIEVETGTRQAARFRAGEVVVCAEVDDTGPGIPENLLPRIFDPFVTTKPTGQGTGLGLTVTRKIIELHGGHIDISNLPAGGTRATIWFKVTE